MRRSSTFAPSKPRRKMLGSALILLVITGVTAAICVPLVAFSAAEAPPTTAAQESGMLSGQTLVDPVDLNTPFATSKAVTLVAAPTQFNIGGKLVWGASYNGSFVGPTMYLQPGQRIAITLINHLATSTNLHFHGLHVSATGSADNPFISVPAGRTFVYHLNIPLNQPIGTYWYHDHDMCMGTGPGMTGAITGAMTGMAGMAAAPSATSSASSGAGQCDDIESQISSGLSGAIIIGDDRLLLPAALQNVTAHTMVLKDMQITPLGTIAVNSAGSSINMLDPTVRLVNGQLRPIITMQPNETQLWRLANAGANIFYKLQLAGYTFTVIGQDGHPVQAIRSVGSLSLPPGKRWDVLVTAQSTPGTSALRSASINTGPDGMYPGATLAKLTVAGTPVVRIGMPTGAMPTAESSLANATIATQRAITLSEGAGDDDTVMFINGMQFDPTLSVFSTPAILGTTEEWTITNLSDETHPFHLHSGTFQVMSINGVRQAYTGPQDTVPIPLVTNGVPGSVVIRIPFTDFTGRVMFHCHIAAHEVAGMMSFISVVRPR